jgi:hypothetical protein
LTHVLNTIDKIEVAEEIVVICGVCSPFLRSKAEEKAAVEPA